jgi:hypothetical protein
MPALSDRLHVMSTSLDDDVIGSKRKFRKLFRNSRIRWGDFGPHRFQLEQGFIFYSMFNQRRRKIYDENVSKSKKL